MTALFWEGADCDPREGRRNLTDGVLALRDTVLKRYRELNDAYVFCKTPRPSDWVSVKGDDDPSTNAPPVPDDGEEWARAYWAPSDIAKKFGVSPGALRKRLERRRSNHRLSDESWTENTDRGVREAGFLYRPVDVMDEVRALQSKRPMSSERPAKKK